VRTTIALRRTNMTDETRYEVLKMEYHEANEWWRSISRMHRTDMAFFTTAQGAVLGLIGDKLFNMSFGHIVLSLMAFLLVFIGIHNEVRLYGYLLGFRRRGEAIERELNISLMTSAVDNAKKAKWTMQRRTMFVSYYVLLAFGWIVIWIRNLF
jgi:hypothetical protein